MIKGQNIICISNTSWFGNYAKSTVQIMERLAAHNRILFVEYHYTVKDIVATLMKKQQAPVARMLGFKPALQQVKTDSDTMVYDLVIPPGVPAYFLKNEKLFNALFAINTAIYRIKLRQVIKKLKFDNPIVIGAYNPFYGLAMLNKLDEKLSLYYCYDGVEAGFFGERIFQTEDSYSKQVKAIITTSDFLKANKTGLNNNCFVVKNGVDFPRFSVHAKKDVYSHSRKKVGFIGSLDPRFDIDTVEYAVKSLPDFDFEFTGDPRNEAMRNRLQEYPNVRFFSPVKPTDVPELLAKYDVGIIPYIVNDVNKNIYPLKINEYLAVGVPVVMNAFASLPEFDGMVSVAHNAEEFVSKLKDEALNDTSDKISARISFASENSWDSRTEEFSSIIANFITG